MRIRLAVAVLGLGLVASVVPVRAFGAGSSSTQLVTVPSSFFASTQKRAWGFIHSVLATTPLIVIVLPESNVAATE